MTNRSIDELIRSWDGQAVVTRYDELTQAWVFICMHDHTLGACTGGTRMKVYPQPSDGLLDAMRLAQGMTHKWAAVDLPYGGGKAAIALDHPLEGSERTEFLLRYGDLVESLRGAFRTGEDLGTSSADMVTIASRTQYIHGFDGRGNKVDPSPFTARGVYAGIKAALEVAYGERSCADRSVLIEGVGNVGTHLAELLAADGAQLLVADLDSARAQAVADRFRATVVPSDEIYSSACDVYAPCAVGATLNQQTIPQLTCRIVAGSANNQLQDLDDAATLHGRGILYVPDFIINAGGAMAFAQIDRGIAEPDRVARRMDDIGDTVRWVLEKAAEHDETTLAAAHRRVRENLSRPR